MFIHSRLLLDECTCFQQRCFSLQRSTRPRKTSVKKSVEETYRSWLQKRLINSFRFSKMTRWRNLWFFIHQSSFFRTMYKLIRSDLSTVGKELLSCLFLRDFETGILQEECCFIAVGKVDIWKLLKTTFQHSSLPVAFELVESQLPATWRT